MYETDPAETFRERHLALVREAEERRLARLLRETRAESRAARSDRWAVGSWRAIIAWRRAATPFFRAWRIAATEETEGKYANER